MSLELDIAILAQVALFKGFEKEHLRLIAFGAKKRSYKSGSVLFKSGSYSDGGYVITNGTVDLISIDKDNSELLASYGPGSLIGELALISKNRRTATAIARKDVETIKITRQLFHRMLEEFPGLAALLHYRISKSVQEFVSRLEAVKSELDHADGIFPG